MGCDIHDTIIARRKSDGKLVDLRDLLKDKSYDILPEFIPGRCYYLFGVLSSVRSSDDYFVTPLRHECVPMGSRQDLEDCHSFTWFLARDLRKYLKKVMANKYADDLFGSCESFRSTPEDEDEVHDNLYIPREQEVADLFDDAMRKIINLQDLLNRIDDYERIVETKLQDFDPRSLVLFFYYDS